MIQLDCNTSLFSAKQKAKAFLLSLSVLTTMLITGCWEVTEVNQVSNNPSTNPTEQNGSHDGKLAHNDIDTNNKISNDKSKQNSQSLPSSQTNQKLDKKTQEVINLQKTPAIPKIFVPESGEPIHYDTNSWYKKNETLKPLKLSNIGSTPEEIAEVISIDENSLDFASHSATKYRFMKSNAPYFDLVDSNDYLEISWYYANPSDSDEEKKISLRHAKKSHKFARKIMGANGGQLVANMLAGKITQNKNINGINVALAKCQFYSCMLVLKKPQSNNHPNNPATTLMEDKPNAESKIEADVTNSN